MIIYKPYVYLIGWSKLNVYYYGSETGKVSKTANPDNLWKTYFTSSKHVKSFRKTNGEPDIIQIRKTFDTKEQASLWEHKVIRRMKAIYDNRFLNKSDTKTHYRIGQKHSDESKEKMSLKRNGKTPSKGLVHSQETKRKISNSHKGDRNYMFCKTHSVEVKNKISEVRKMEIWRCDICNKEGKIMSNFVRWHGNCGKGE